MKKMANLLSKVFDMPFTKVKVELVANFANCEGRLRRTFDMDDLLREGVRPDLAALRTLGFFAEARKLLVHCDLAVDPDRRWDERALQLEEPYYRERRISVRCPAHWSGAKVLSCEEVSDVLETIQASGTEHVEFLVKWASSLELLKLEGTEETPEQVAESSSADEAQPAAADTASRSEPAPGFGAETIVQETIVEIDDFLQNQEWAA
ncbi:hypothetical protein NKR23_g9361 [Pleurostoma richardsiae]|uniref:Uncharacterized protein n=1 Tax=Pleurostoma richardsiae TaxID=41990 RepID=A0AA38R4N0_9PEZI|nr:hypothetical protein NKR23_g9361 [Pleurostoma richardsiae]